MPGAGMRRLDLIYRLSRGIASAAPKTSTGIEHADSLAKAGGRKANWKLYKVGDYLNMNNYSFYQAEITMAKHRLQQPTNKKPDVLPKVKPDLAPKPKPQLHLHRCTEVEEFLSLWFGKMDSVVSAAVVQSLSSLPAEDACRRLEALNASLTTRSKFEDVDRSAREEIVKLVENLCDRSSLVAPILELIRILARDKTLLDVLLVESVRLFILRSSGLTDISSSVIRDVLEADKCLVNTLFNSPQMRQTFETQAPALLLDRISAFAMADYSGKYEWLNEIPEDSRNTVWLLDLRIAFLVSAHSSEIQSKWGTAPLALTTFLDIIRQYTSAAAEVECFEPEEASRRLGEYIDRAAEAAKTLFNITYKRSDDIDEEYVDKITEAVAALIKAKPPSPVMEQHAVNLLATLKLNTSLLCPK
ncbi:hypothetical protein NECAME_12681, partial [Necator americanus]